MLYLLLKYILTKEAFISPQSLPHFNLARLTYGSKDVLRLIDPANITEYNKQDIWDIGPENFKFTLLKDGSHICGKNTDPGVIPCKDQNYKINFVTIKKDATNFVSFKTDDNLCLTKTGLDPSTKGFYMNLKLCTMSDDQLFIIKYINDLSDHEEELLPILTDLKTEVAMELNSRAKSLHSHHSNSGLLIDDHKIENTYEDLNEVHRRDHIKKRQKPKLTIMEEHDIWLQHERKYNSDTAINADNNHTKIMHNKLHHNRDHTHH